MLLGRGKTCEIWLGVLEGVAGFRKPVVLKHAVSGSLDLAESEQTLVAEAHLGAALNHPNLVHIYELVDFRDGVALAMEYLSGFSLRFIVTAMSERQIKVPWPIAARIVADAARGLDAAHRAQSPSSEPLRIVHRDVNPENLFVTDDGISKVVDFGIARSAMREQTAEISVKGKIPYLSPEQATGQPLDWRTDVFSLGIVLHELVTGQELFTGDDDAEIIDAIVRKPIAPMPEGIDPVVRDVVGRGMLVRDVRRRRVTMREVADALEAAASGKGGTHRHVGAFLRAEFREQLTRRRARLKSVLDRVVEAPPRPESVLGAGTMVLVESGLDSVEFSDGDTVSDLEESSEPVTAEQAHGEELLKSWKNGSTEELEDDLDTLPEIGDSDTFVDSELTRRMRKYPPRG